MPSYVNLTQHTATPTQVAAGVIDLSPELREKVSAILTFSDLPDQREMDHHAYQLLELWDVGVLPSLGIDTENTPADQWPVPMVGGAPWFMSTIESVFLADRQPVAYAFSKRESVEQQMTDGTVRKVAVFQHLGFITKTP